MPKMAASKGKPATKKNSAKPKDKAKCKSGNGSGSSSNAVSSGGMSSGMSGLDSPSNPEQREETALGFPLPKTTDTSRTLPRYYAGNLHSFAYFGF